MDLDLAPAPVLTTDRFTLWKPRAGDLDALCTLVDDPDTQRFLGAVPPDRKAQAERLLRNAGSWALYNYGSFLVRPAGSEAVIGTCGVFHSFRGFGKGLDDVPEAGWIIRRDWWGKGVASEVMCKVLGWFDDAHGKQRIACMIEQGNLASERVAQKLGFTRYGDHAVEDGALLWLYQRLP